MTIMTLVAGDTGLPLRLEVAVLTDLVQALAATAPSGCAVRVLTPSDYPELEFGDLRAWQEYSAFSGSLRKRLWRFNAFSRQGRAEILHALSPVAPLRPGGVQSIVTVPFLRADQLGAGAAARADAADKTRQVFLQRAASYADMLVVPDFHTATLLQTHFAASPAVRVLTEAAPSVLLNLLSESTCKVPGVDSGGYALVPATASMERVTELLQVLAADPLLPQRVVVGVLPGQKRSRQELPAECVEVTAPDFAGFAGVLSGAGCLVLTEEDPTARYLAHAALELGVPVVHAEVPQVAEVVADTGYAYANEVQLAAALSELYASNAEYAAARVRARDRAGCYSWEFTAAALWQLHAEV